ncbi:hypothetical protein ACP4OV_018453 [Aristida adscensionis]
MAAAAVALTSQKATATCLLALLLTGWFLASVIPSTEARHLVETSHDSPADLQPLHSTTSRNTRSLMGLTSTLGDLLNKALSTPNQH